MCAKKKLKGYIALSILLVLCFIMASLMIFITPKNNANAFQGAANIGSQSTNLGEMLLDGYENRSGGKTFDKDVFWNLISQITGEKNPNMSTLTGLGGTERASAYFRANNKALGNGEKDVVVTIGGIPWTVTYLSQNASGEPILTLWQADARAFDYYNASTKALVKNAVTTTFSTSENYAVGLAAYPSNSYGTSFMATQVLNNGGDWAKTNSGTPIEVAQSDKNTYAKFTMDNVTGSLTGFIEIPNNAPYQKNSTKESAKEQINHSSYNNDTNNDVLGAPISDNMQDEANTYFGNEKVNQTGYLAWGNDRIWLPSLAEVGYNDTVDGNGLWDTSTNQRSTSTSNGVSYSWLRSATYNVNSPSTFILSTSGTVLAHGDVKLSYAVRPAFHLNLKKASQSIGLSEMPETKGDILKYYTGGDVTFELDKINEDVVEKVELISTNLDSNDITKTTKPVTTEITPTYANGGMSFKVQDVGKYTIKITLKTNPDQYYWSDGKTSKEFDYILKYHVTPLDWADSNSMEYNGQTQYFELANYDEEKMSVNLTLVKVAKDNNGSISEDASGTLWAISAKNFIDNAMVTVSLKNKDYMEWTDGTDASNKTADKTSMKYSITKKPLTHSLDDPTAVWSELANASDKTYDIYINGCVEEDISDIKFKGSYKKDGSSDEPTQISGQLSAVKESDGRVKVTVTLPKLEDYGKYIYYLDLTPAAITNRNANYTFSFNRKFDVENKKLTIDEDDINWHYTNKKLGTNYIPVQKTDIVNGVFAVEYNGDVYSFELIESGLSGDAEYVVSGEEYAKDVKFSGKTVAEYIITLTITPKDGVDLTNPDPSSKFKTIEFKWRIDQGRYVLDGVTWQRYQNGDELSSDEYNKNLQTMKLKGLPSTLQVTQYIDNEMTNVGKYEAEVYKIVNSDPNYVEPDIDDPTTYIYQVSDENPSGLSFPWKQKWEIKKQGITLIWDVVKSDTDKNGKTFYYFEVGGEHASKIKGYKYYNKGDYSKAGGAAGQDITLNQFEVKSPTLMWYWAVAELTDDAAKNYEITKDKELYFSIGSNKTEVAVTLNNGNHLFQYDTDPHGGELTLSVSALNLGDLNLTYYENVGTQDLLGVPTDSGDYRVEISLKSSYTNTYELVGAVGGVVKIYFTIQKVSVTIVDNTASELYYNKGEQGLDLSVTSDGLTLDDIEIKYYNKVNDEEIEGKPINAGDYYAILSLSEELAKNYDLETSRFEMTINKVVLTVITTTDKITYDGQTHEVEFSVKEKVSGADFGKDNIIKKYYKDSKLTENELKDELPTNARKKYIVEYLLKDEVAVNYEIEEGKEAEFEIEKIKIKAVWNTSGQIPVLSNLDEKLKEVVGYVYYDENGEQLDDDAKLEEGKSYKVKAILTGSYGDNYEFVEEDGETVLDNPVMTDEQDFTVKDNNNGQGGNVGIGSGNPSGPAVSGTLDEILAKLKEIPLWQLIASVISIILTIIFLSKTASYDSKRKKFNKKTDKLESMYAGAFLGVAMSIWTAIACVLIGLAVMSLVMMLIAKSRCNKAEEAYEDGLDEYNRNKKDEEKQEARQRDENLRMMLMGMGNNGGMAQGMPQGYAYQQSMFGIDEMRGLISETVTALLPNMQQMLPQQASSNDELVQKLIDENAKSQETIHTLMERLAEQPVEREVEREVAATAVNDETIKQMMKTQENLMHNQEKLMEKILELSATQPQHPQVQVVEKEIPVEKIVEKIVEVPVEVEKIVEKEVKVEVPVEVEKIVEKEVVKEVKVEVPVAVPTPSKPKKEVAPRLTLDEAYAGLSKQQQKYFDGLKQYALTKDKCKEKKSTYFILFGQSSVNPLMKLTIKKDTVVALFKMEDEYMKDIRKDATSDGTKVKVKETEVIISDAQACKVAKNMIDLREDQIERYQDLLKEQRAIKNKK